MISSSLSTINPIGHYCGRFAEGFWGEPLNSLTNLAFILGALIAWRAWRRRGGRGAAPGLLFILCGSIGLGSFIFHSVPTPATLMGDLVPIQIFGLAFMGFVARMHLRFSRKLTLACLLVFFVARQGWIAAVPGSFLGGGVTHLPTLLVLVALALRVRKTGSPLWRYMLGASVAYLGALVFRSWDLAVCAQFPWGLHWVWHLLTALTASLLVYGLAISAQSEERDAKFGRR